MYSKDVKIPVANGELTVGSTVGWSSTRFGGMTGTVEKIIIEQSQIYLIARVNRNSPRYRARTVRLAKLRNLFVLETSVL